MTTPMKYLHFWFIKDKISHNYPKDFSVKLGSICLSIDNAILSRFQNSINIREDYLNYFCSFNDFQTMAIDLGYRDEYFIWQIQEIFFIKFPMEKHKLVKMWNLKPKGI